MNQQTQGGEKAMGNAGNTQGRRPAEKGSQPDDSFRDRSEMGYEEERDLRNQPWSPAEKPEYLSSQNVSDESRSDSDEGYGYGKSGSNESDGEHRGGYGAGEFGYGKDGSEQGGGDQGDSRFGYGGQGEKSSGPDPESPRDPGYGRSGQGAQDESRGGYGGTSDQDHDSGGGPERG